MTIGWAHFWAHRRNITRNRPSVIGLIFAHGADCAWDLCPVPSNEWTGYCHAARTVKTGSDLRSDDGEMAAVSSSPYPRDQICGACLPLATFGRETLSVSLLLWAKTPLPFPSSIKPCTSRDTRLRKLLAESE